LLHVTIVGGQCCHYWHRGRFNKCKHLVRLPSGKTLCRIYNKRLGTVLANRDDGTMIVCSMRNQLPQNFKDCPYNEPHYNPIQD